MPDANALNRGALVAAILGRRFPAASQTTNAQRWLNTAYQDVWDAFDWTFKRVSLSTLSIVSGDETPVMPSDYGDTYTLLDQNGEELTRMSQADFEWEFGPDLTATAPVGSPWAYTVVNRQIMLAPKPGITGDFKHSYRRRVSHLQSDQTTVAAGAMDADTDYPLWPDHHGILIPRAQSIGLKEINDPTWPGPQGEYELQLDRMLHDLEPMRVGDHATRGTSQWGRN